MTNEIIIHPYDPQWRKQFYEIARPIRAVMGKTASRIDHIGSTSVEGLAAKPIIDVQISVQSFEPFDEILMPLEALGYEWRDDNPERTKRYFREIDGQRTHIHVRIDGSWSEQFNLLFRDYLRQNRTARDAYEETKKVLAEQFRQDRAAYTNGKTDIIWQIIQAADEWSKEVGWQPPASDV